MSRKYVYFCDCCGTNFGDNKHLNVKNAEVYVSEKDTERNRWVQRPMKRKPVGTEYHFCNIACLIKWIERQAEANM